jgi:hypothetical protein
LEARIAFGRALRDRSDRRADGLLRAGSSRRIFLQQRLGQGNILLDQLVDLSVFRGQLPGQGFLNLHGWLFAGVLVFNNKGDNRPYASGDDDRSAADQGKDRAYIGILDNFPQPKRHFLKTARKINLSQVSACAKSQLRTLRKSVCANRSRLRRAANARQGEPN